MNDLSLIYYTANKIDIGFADRVRSHLKNISDLIGAPIISVSQKPLNFGDNVCVGDIGISTYNVYRQIMIGAIKAQTEFVACCEDDTLYTIDHFDARPPADEFWYNKSRWWVEPQGVYRWRDRTAMHACIAPRKLMVETLLDRFKKYPTPLFEKKQLRSWGEPGRYEGNLNLPHVERKFFRSKTPIVTFDHKGSLYGLRRWNDSDIIKHTIAPWGDAKDIIARFCNGKPSNT